MSAASNDAHVPYRDTFLVPALTAAVARIAADAAAGLALDDDTARAELDATYGDGVGAIFLDARTWSDALRTLPDACACCAPEYTPTYEQFERAADVAGRMIGDGLLQRLYGSAPVSAPQWAEAVRRWLSRTEVPLPLVALVTSATMDLAVPPDRRRAPAADKLHQAFDRFCKGRGLDTWPKVIAAIDEGWNTAAVAWPLLISAEQAVNALDAGLRESEAREQAARGEIDAARRDAAAAQRAQDATQLEQGLRSAEARIRELEEQLAAARRDAADARVRASRAQTALDRVLNPETPEPDEPAADGPAAVAPDLTPPPPAPEPEDPFPLRGERVYLFTNQEREGVRTEQAAALEALGAEVTVYYNKSLRTRAPDAFPEDVIVVSDVAFAPHAKTDEIKKRAKKSGVRYVEGKFGAGSIGRAVADYVKLQRERAAAREA